MIWQHLYNEFTTLGSRRRIIDHYDPQIGINSSLETLILARVIATIPHINPHTNSLAETLMSDNLGFSTIMHPPLRVLIIHTDDAFRTDF